MYELKSKANNQCIVHKHLLQFFVILFCMFSMTNSSSKQLVTSSSVLFPTTNNYNAVYHRHKDSNTKQDQNFEKENKFNRKFRNIKVSSSNKNSTPRAASPINPRTGKQLFPSMSGYVKPMYIEFLTQYSSKRFPIIT